MSSLMMASMHGHRLGSVATVAGVVSVLAAGCDLPRTSAVRQHRGVYPVAVWYYVRGYVPEADEQARSVLASDFAHVRSLGFNTIIADGVEDDDRAVVLDVAEAQSLQVVLSHAATRTYIRQGQSNAAARSEVKSSIRANVESVGRHAALYMHYVYDAPTSDVGERLAEVVRLYRSLDPAHDVFVMVSQYPTVLVRQADLPIVLWDNFPVSVDGKPGELRNRRYATPPTHGEALADIYAQTPDRRHWAMIQALAMQGRLRMPTPAEWDLMYMTALAVGFVDGVVFYRYHTDKDSDSGLSPADHAMPPQRARAVRHVTKRALKWGRMLSGAKPSTEAVRCDGERFRTAVLTGPKRQFLLVYNPSAETFAQDTVYVPTVVQGRRVARAVNVDEPKRYLPKGATAEIPIKFRLRPGNGKLLELFGP